MNHENQPIRARGTYDMSFVDWDNEYESYPEQQRVANESRFQRDFAHYLELYNADAVSDEQFEREFTYERLLQLDEQLEKRGGLTATQIHQILPPKRGLVVDCAICMEKTKTTEKVICLTKCPHKFHARCLQTWFAEHVTCPLCRTPVIEKEDSKTVDEEDEEEENRGAQTQQQRSATSGNQPH